MKRLSIVCISILITISCSQKKEKKIIESISSEIQLRTIPETLVIPVESSKIYRQWIQYYKTNDTTFSIDKFKLESVDSLRSISGNVYGVFDEEFDSIYSNFLVYKSDKKQYVDFDSYQWSLDENKVPVFSPDQEVNLVDIEDKTVTRIGFRGPSQWVENIFWENDSTIVFLENINRKQLVISKINLNQKNIHTYFHKDSLLFESIYPELRFRAKTGIIIN